MAKRRHRTYMSSLMSSMHFAKAAGLTVGQCERFLNIRSGIGRESLRDVWPDIYPFRKFPR
jgi:hypothetical protein